MMLGQLSNRESLRESNDQPPWHFRKEICVWFNNDSTTINSIHYEPNNYYIFDRTYDSFKELYRIHLTDSFFVVRTKTNLKYKTVKWKRRMQKNIMTDAEVKTNRIFLWEEISGVIQARPILRWRRWPWVHFSDECKTTFYTGCCQSLQEKMVDWTILKMDQPLKIKKLWGTTENAVHIQISVAIITYCLVAIVQHNMKLKRFTYEVLQILSISFTDKTHLRNLFDKNNFNDIKDLNDPLILGLFD